ncbi:TlpA disulfide reductase family protein [Hymenobacter sp. YC55]|uniref:TlpA disulfide reductase family protein n=1 Tax=Hymenobacter sp. YC55 TaxID=3034019 RepID=UPI0023F65FF3|nr:TlpA disulfide reductase family protein [Hymenobacter sp. YC55]MDF7815687.1 TlpA disulfide reductase family protein [Hymenobacter sp. YC55]
MKNYLIFLLLVPGLAVAQTPIPYFLAGKLGSDTYRGKPTYVYLRSGSLLDSALVKKGRFQLKGTVDEPHKAFLSMKRQSEDMSDYKAIFYLEAGTLVFTSPDSLKNARVGGTPLTDVWRALLAAQEPITQQLDALYNEFEAATPAQQQSLAFQQRLRERRAATLRAGTRLDSAFVRAHPTSIISLYQLNRMSKDSTHAALVTALLPTLSPPLRNDALAEQIRTRIGQAAWGPTAEPVLKVGMMAPNFTQSTPDGQQVSLTDYRGKYVLVDFWASWCRPCREENPNLTKVYNQYKDKNFDVLGVSLDEARDRAKWVKAIQNDQLPWTQVADLKGWGGQAAASYFIKFIPQNFLVDPTGKIIAVNLRGDALPEVLARLVK